MDESRQTTNCPSSNLNAGVSTRTFCHKFARYWLCVFGECARVIVLALLPCGQNCPACRQVTVQGGTRATDHQQGAREITHITVQALDRPTAQARSTYLRFMFFASTAQVDAYAVKRNPDQVWHLDQEGRQWEN
jgi:hypothetical protein